MNQICIINEGMCFEIYCKTELNILNKFLGKKGRGQNYNVKKRVNTVNLPKLEKFKFNEDPTKCQSFFDLFQAAAGKSTNLTGVKRFCYLKSDSHVPKKFDFFFSSPKTLLRCIFR